MVAVITLIAYPGGQTEDVATPQQAVEAAAISPQLTPPDRIAETAPPAVSMKAAPEPETVAAVLAVPATPPPLPPVADDTASVIPVPPVPPEPVKARAAPRLARPSLPIGERMALVRTAQPESELCRRILVKVQLGEDASDAERRFMRGGCRP